MWIMVKIGIIFSYAFAQHPYNATSLDGLRNSEWWEKSHDHWSSKDSATSNNRQEDAAVDDVCQMIGFSSASKAGQWYGHGIHLLHFCCGARLHPMDAIEAIYSWRMYIA